MPIFAVQYSYTDATTAGRDAHRATHREWLRGLLDQGVLRSSGPYPDGTGALILIEAPDAATAEETMAADPFQREGVVDNSRIVEWQPVMGTFAD